MTCRQSRGRGPPGQRRLRGRRAPRPIHVIRRRFGTTAAPPRRWRTRGIVAAWDARADQLTVWDTTQAPVLIRNGLAAMLGLSEQQVRVIAPFIGGGFGPKMMMFYPEEVLVPWVAMRLDRPVKWIEDRLENFFATTQERGQVHEAEIALDARRPDPRRARCVPARHRRLRPLRPDRAAQQPMHAARAATTSRTMTAEFTAVFTNKPIVTPYRGAGRQHGVFVMERLLDIAARELGHRPRRDPPAQLHPAGRLPLQQRDHLPGLRAAGLRQRQLPARSSKRRCGDRL